MFRSQNLVAGFASRTDPVASPKLINAVAASLVFGALSLCLCVGLTLMASVASFAAPLAH